MKNLSITNFSTKFLAVAFAAAALVSTSNAVAQSTLNVTVPFAFENGSQHLPAGKYALQMQSEHMLLIRGASNGGFAMTNTEQALKAPEQGKVTFRKYGDRYFIREVWVAGSHTGIQCVKSRAEKQVQLAQNTPVHSDVELALNDSPK